MLAAVTSVMTAASARCWRIVASSPVEFVVLDPERVPHQVAA